MKALDVTGWLAIALSVGLLSLSAVRLLTRAPGRDARIHRGNAALAAGILVGSMARLARDLPAWLDGVLHAIGIALLVTGAALLWRARRAPGERRADPPARRNR